MFLLFKQYTMIFTLLFLFAVTHVDSQLLSNDQVLEYKQLIESSLTAASRWKYPNDSRNEFEPEDEDPILYGNFDYIIVGAGSSGLVLARRLTDNPFVKVLLLEAGGFESRFSEIPGFATFVQNSDLNWGYKSTPQKTACLGMKERKCTYPLGKAVGGSSSINLMIHARGNQEDFDAWAAAGNTGWSYKEALYYFKKSESATFSTADTRYHGHDGPLNVEFVRFNSPMTDIFLEATNGRNPDYNAANQTGFSQIQMTTKNGRRWSAAKAFLDYITIGRQNLYLEKNALVVEVLTEKQKAFGVGFIQNHKLHMATAKREVILSAGTINSAQLLMLSGIGPKSTLHKHQIPLVKDLNVGATLLDHPIFVGLPFATNITVQPDNMLQQIEQYLKGRGALTSAGGITGIGFLQTTFKLNSHPDMEFLFLSGTASQLQFYLTEAKNIRQENFNAIWGSIQGILWMMAPVLLKPKSTGNVELKSNHPLDFPLINPNYLSDAKNEDLEQMLLGVRRILEISKSRAFRSIKSKYVSKPLPECSHIKHMSSKYWRCSIRQLTTTFYHPVGTCKMGPASDRTAVVDNELRVHGVENLRVVDASVIPTTLSGHTDSAAYMIAEKAADLIKTPSVH